MDNVLGMLLGILPVTVLAGIPLARIAWRVGYPVWFACLALIPLLGLLMYLFLALWRWPIPDAGSSKYERW